MAFGFYCRNENDFFHFSAVVQSVILFILYYFSSQKIIYNIKKTKLEREYEEGYFLAIDPSSSSPQPFGTTNCDWPDDLETPLDDHDDNDNDHEDFIVL